MWRRSHFVFFKHGFHLKLYSRFPFCIFTYFHLFLMFSVFLKHREQRRGRADTFCLHQGGRIVGVLGNCKIHK